MDDTQYEIIVVLEGFGPHVHDVYRTYEEALQTYRGVQQGWREGGFREIREIQLRKCETLNADAND